MVDLDGSLGEGGGQILRTSLALSLLTGKPFRLRHVRARRPKPGLQPQHLASVQAAVRIGGGSARGASVGSSDLEFHPGVVTAGDFSFDIGTAGATSLVLHTVYLPLALRGDGPSRLHLVGGTHVLASPCFHFLQTTWASYLVRMGLEVSVVLHRTGFYPRGGGRVEAVVKPSLGVRGLALPERGPLHARGFSAVAGLPDHIARRQADRLTQRLERDCGLRVRVTQETWAGGPGTVVAVILEGEPAPTLYYAVGERGKPAEKVADEVVDQVASHLAAAPAAVDPHSADQLLLPLALAEEASEYTVTEVTQHLLTNVEVIRRFVDRDIVCDGSEGERGVVRIR